MLNAVHQIPPPIFEIDRTNPLCTNIRLVAPLTPTFSTTNMVDMKRGVNTGMTYAASRHGPVGNFDGSSYLTFRTLPEIISDKAFSVSFWSQITSGSAWCWMGSMNTGAAGFIVTYNLQAANKLSWTKAGVLNVNFDWIPDTGIHHFVFASDQSNVYWYLDGVLQSTQANTGAISLAGCPVLAVGANNFTGSIFDKIVGKMWSVCVWDKRTLNAAEVKQIYTQPFFYFQNNATFRPLVTGMTGSGGGGGSGFTAGTGIGSPWSWWDEE